MQIIRLPPKLYGVFFDNELIGYGEGHDNSYRTSTSIWTLDEDYQRQTPQTIWGRVIWQVWFRTLILTRLVDDLPIALVGQQGREYFKAGFMLSDSILVSGPQYIHTHITIPFMERTVDTSK